MGVQFIEMDRHGTQGMQLQRQAMDQRIASSGGANQPMPTSSPSVAQGFLTRQRQTSIRGRPANINHQGFVISRAMIFLPQNLNYIAIKIIELDITSLA